MADIKIGYDLVQDSESYLEELTDNDTKDVVGGNIFGDILSAIQGYQQVQSAWNSDCRYCATNTAAGG
jgi:hypothetical protein